MKNLRRDFERFCYRNRDKGIPNLMLFIAIGNLVVYLFSLFDPSNLLYVLLRFDRTAILHGQVWRLFTYIFTYLLDARGLSLLIGLLSLFCYYWMGRNLQNLWGTMRFNLYYLCGVILMDIAALLIGCNASTTYLNLSLFLAIATVAPDTRFLLFYIIPVKAKYLAWFDIALTLYGVISQLLRSLSVGIFSLRILFFCLFPIIALLNYVLFFGSDIKNILPDALRYRQTHTQRNYRTKTASHASQQAERPYRHKCTVCGRTDADFPNLEFRYCSRCKGYYCYCSEHINNHTHIQ